jgi:cytochrome o ubiquinol oxidase operon protein cyoD
MSSARHEPQRIAHDEFHEPEPYTLRGYLVGFGVSALLTILAFWIVMSGVIPRAGLASAAVVTLAVIQILVQTGAFLHVNSRAQGGWTLIAYVFTAVLLLITIAGSVWIMYHLNVNMMPGMMQADPPVNQPP